MANADLPPEADAIIGDVVALIVEDDKYRDRTWDAIALMAIVTDTSVDMTGFSYGDGVLSKPDCETRSFGTATLQSGSCPNGVGTTGRTMRRARLRRRLPTNREVM